MSAIGPAESRPGALQSALDADLLAFDGLACYVAGTGPPMLLIHSVNAAASAAEVRPLFEHFRATQSGQLESQRLRSADVHLELDIMESSRQPFQAWQRGQ